VGEDTTLAQIIASRLKTPFYTLSAVTSGVKDVRDVIERAKSSRFFSQANPVLFIDEIHRFSKSQQDSLLGAVEQGVVTLIGATTENPSFEVIRPLLSRCQVYTLEPLDKDDMVILALPAPALSKYVRDINEYETSSILNIHYKSNAVLKNGRSYAGLIYSARADFVFVRNGVVSVTISAADALLKRYSPDMLAGLIWQDLAKVLIAPEKRPPYRAVVNKRATPVQTPEFNAGRPHTDIGDYVIFLASDFVQTGLPCTMESAVIAGMNAAQAVMDRL